MLSNYPVVALSPATLCQCDIKFTLALAWPVEAAVTPSGQRKDVVSRGACWGMPSPNDKEHIWKNTGTCTSVQALCTPTRRMQWANGGTEIKLLIATHTLTHFAPFWLRSSPKTRETWFFQFRHTFTALASYTSARFSLQALPWLTCVGVDTQTNQMCLKAHIWFTGLYEVHVRSFGRVARTSKHHWYELPKELFHRTLREDVFVFPQLLLTDVPSPLLNYQK